jgi:hypothetical protein
MTNDEIPEDLVPHERHWALSADFIAASVAILACVVTVVIFAVSAGWGGPR